MWSAAPRRLHLIIAGKDATTKEPVIHTLLAGTILIMGIRGKLLREMLAWFYLPLNENHVRLPATPATFPPSESRVVHIIIIIVIDLYRYKPVYTVRCLLLYGDNIRADTLHTYAGRIGNRLDQVWHGSEREQFRK